MRRVIIESPYAGALKKNQDYARKAMMDCLIRGESPLVSHLLYTQVLSDMEPAERQLGIDAGHAWLHCCNAVVVYHDLGISKGMELGILRAAKAGVKIEYRKLFKSEDHLV